MNMIVYIPIILFWVLFVSLVCGGAFCSLYSRVMVRHEAKRVLRSQESPKEEYKNQDSRKQTLKENAQLIMYGLCRYYSILIGKIPSNHVRKALLRLVFSMKIHPKAVIYGGFEIRSPWNVSIENAVIGVGALLDGRQGIVIHNNAVLAQNVSVFTLQHDVNDEMFRTNDKGGKVEIDCHAWICSNTTILPKTHVGEGAVLAAGAVATKNLEPFGIYAGVPARKVRDRNHNLKYYNCTANYWHFY